MDYVALDTDVASKLIKHQVPPVLLAKLARNDMWNAACCLVENLPLATLNMKDYLDFAEHGLKIISSD